MLVYLGNNLLAYKLCTFVIIFIQGGVFSWFSSFTPKVFGYK